MSFEFNHLPVMPEEVIKGLNIKPDGLYFDGTLGGAGHSKLILQRLTTGELIGVDRDADALAAAKERLAEFAPRVTFVHDNFENIKAIAGERRLDGVLLDLGVSSFQLDTAERGFSYMQNARLDMRMNREQELSAFDVVNGYSADKLTQIIRDYGEERQAGRIARAIVNQREHGPIETTLQLSDIVRTVLPTYRDPHPEKRTFQAIRIEVNRELEVITPTIDDAISCMKSGGRIAVITFHSLEDRLTKQAFARNAKGCICPPEIPVCVCNKKPLGFAVNKKPIVAGEEELKQNKRSASAKLRIFEVY